MLAIGMRRPWIWPLPSLLLEVGVVGCDLQNGALKGNGFSSELSGRRIKRSLTMSSVHCCPTLALEVWTMVPYGKRT